MKKAILTTAVFVISVLVVSQIEKPIALAQGGGIYYLSPSGDDSQSGLSEGEAWATFNRAWSDIYPGDTLVLLDGVYYQSLNPNRRNGEPGNPITIRAKNDGQAIIDGQYTRIPVRLGDTWPGPIGDYFVIEGIVARNSGWSVYEITGGQHNVLRRVSGYNANPDENAHVFQIWADNNVIEDCIASGTGRKMIVIFQGENNIIRRCFANWERWDGRNWHDAWPWGDNIQIYHGNYNIIENSIAYGSVPLWSISVQAQIDDPTSTAIGNQVLGSMAIQAGMNHDGTVKYWGCPEKPEPCDASDRPQPTSYTDIRDFDWPSQRAGFVIYGDGEIRDNLFQDIYSWGNAGLGLTFMSYSPHPNNGNNVIRRATMYNNGLDNPDGPWGKYGGIGTDSIQDELDLLDVIEDSEIGQIAVDWPDYYDGGQPVTTSISGGGAQLSYRYVDGVLTSEPLWPWPMADRIQNELGISVADEIQSLVEQGSVPSPTPTVPPASPTPTPTLPSSPEALLTLNSPISVKPGETFEVSVVAQSVPTPGLYGVQFEINYDPSLISTSDLQVNPNLPFVVLNRADNTTGRITLAASKQGKVSGLTGDVTLLSFQATAADTEGTATFSFENEKFSDFQAQGFDINSKDYSITIGQATTPEPTIQPTLTPTLEPTPTPTNEPTSEPTPAPTGEPTPQPTTAEVSGQIVLAGRSGNNWSGATVVIDEEQSDVTDKSGNFNISNLSSGLLDSVRADAPGYLSTVCTDVTVVAPQTVLTPVTLLSGDINDDELVDIVDATAVGASFGQTGQDLSADITLDELVDIFDIVLVSVNFGEEGPQAWGCLNN